MRKRGGGSPAAEGRKMADARWCRGCSVNILLTSTGRRGYLAGYFADAMEKLGIHGMVYAGDAEAPLGALAAADPRILPIRTPPIGSERSEQSGRVKNEPESTEQEPESREEEAEPEENLKSQRRISTVTWEWNSRQERNECRKLLKGTPYTETGEERKEQSGRDEGREAAAGEPGTEKIREQRAAGAKEQRTAGEKEQRTAGAKEQRKKEAAGQEDPPETAYITFLLDFTGTHDIDLVVPCIDKDVLVLSRYRDRFLEEGVFVLAPRAAVADICDNKWMMYCVLSGLGFPVPETVLGFRATGRELMHGNLRYPLVIKPVHGNGSIGRYVVRDEEEMEVLGGIAEERAETEPKIWKEKTHGSRESGSLLVIQEKKEGQEYGLDCISDLRGIPQVTIVKKKLSMRDGETWEAVTEKNPVLEDLGNRLSAVLPHPGIMDVDVIVSEDGTPWILDCNPRFGGGFPYSYNAGCDLPSQILVWLLEWKNNPEEKTPRGAQRREKEIPKPASQQGCGQERKQKSEEKSGRKP